MQKKLKRFPAARVAVLLVTLLAGGCRSTPPQHHPLEASRKTVRLDPSRPAPVAARPESPAEPSPPAPEAQAAPAVALAAAERVEADPPSRVIPEAAAETNAPARKSSRKSRREKEAPESLAPEKPAPAVALTDSYRVQPGDSLKIEVFQEPDISRIFKVSEVGTINHPLLGKVSVTNLGLDAVETRIRDLLAADYLVDPKVIVTLERSAGRPVIVFGEVKTPGVYEITPGEKLTLLQLVGRAGGFTDIAAIDKVRIIRPREKGEETIRVKVSELLQGRDRKDMDLQPGDVLIVPRTIF